MFRQLLPTKYWAYAVFVPPRGNISMMPFMVVSLV